MAVQDQLYPLFLKLVQLGIGQGDNPSIIIDDWEGIRDWANRHGLLAIITDGIEQLPTEKRPPKQELLQWIGEVMQMENQYAVQQNAAAEMALLFHHNYIRTYVLKGAVIAECYPKPEHRVSVDLDCYLLPQNGEFDAWNLGNDLIKSQYLGVVFDFYKNSTFKLPGLTVENHQFMVPFRGNKTLTDLEFMLRSYMREDKGEDRFDGTWLYRPPVMVSALFLIEHAYSHFLHEGLTWRHVLDWMMFSRKHKKKIDWYVLDALIDEFGFRKFYDSYYRLGKCLMGELDEKDLTAKDRRMLVDVWANLDLPTQIRV